jgi:glycosyltransferase involved in cell wall biosynthesis
MRVGVDGRRLAGGDGGLRQARGIARYGERMLEALEREFPGDEWVISGAGQGRAARAAAALMGRPRLDRAMGGELDVVWLPAPGPVAVSPGVPYVLTLHDLSFLARPEDLSPYERLWARAMRPRKLARKAARVIAVSKVTRDEAVGRLGLDAAQVEVIPSGAPSLAEPEAAAIEEVRRRHGLPERYFLFVGALEPRKSPDLLVRAHAEARGQGLQAGLVLAGGGRLRSELGAPEVSLLGRVPDAELAPLYAGAVATVLPSRAEGFGFTPLESLAAGTPAVVSDLPVLREMLGDGALFFPPGDQSALASALLQIERDAQLWTRLVEAGRAAASGLSWRSAARRTREVLAQAAES